MSLWLLAWVLAVFSTTMIALLAWFDPKRQRNQPGAQVAKRRQLPGKIHTALLLLAATPALLLMMLGEWAALTIWAGLTPMLSWFWVVILASHDQTIEQQSTR